MQTPVILVAGQVGTADASRMLLRQPATMVLTHQSDEHDLRRTTAMVQNGVLVTAQARVELVSDCVDCTILTDVMRYLRQLHLRDDVKRVVVRLPPWMEPEPLCELINAQLRAHAVGHIQIAGVVTCIDSSQWLGQALSAQRLPDGRTTAQVVVGQAEFADVLLIADPGTELLAVMRRLAPRARIAFEPGHIDPALASLNDDCRRGRGDNSHGALLRGSPPLDSDGAVRLVMFESRRPFHPGRLHTAIGPLLNGVIRARGRLWLSSRPDDVMCLQSAGAGFRITHTGKWMAAMTADAAAHVDPERRTMATLLWHPAIGDRHTSLTILTCGADPGVILDALASSLLTDDEMSTPNHWPDDDTVFGAALTVEEPCAGRPVEPTDNPIAPIAPRSAAHTVR